MELGYHPAFDESEATAKVNEIVRVLLEEQTDVLSKEDLRILRYRDSLRDQFHTLRNANPLEQPTNATPPDASRVIVPRDASATCVESDPLDAEDEIANSTYVDPHIDNTIANLIGDAYVKKEVLSLNEQLEAIVTRWCAVSDEAKIEYTRCRTLKRELAEIERKLAEHSSQDARLRQIIRRKGADCANTGHHKNTYFYRFGVPYFKSKQRFPADRNTDLAEIIGMRQPMTLRMPCVKRLRAKDAKFLDNAVLAQLKQTRTAQLRKRLREAVAKRQTRPSDENLSTRISRIEHVIRETANVTQIMDTKDWDVPIDFLALPASHRFTCNDFERLWRLTGDTSLTRGEFSDGELEALRSLAAKYGAQDWERIAAEMPTKRSAFQCFTKYAVVEKKGKHQPWSKEEDKLLTSLATSLAFITKSDRRYQWWRNIRRHFPNRSYAQIHAHWMYVLQPGLKKGRFTEDEHRRMEALLRQGKTYQEVAAIVRNRTCVQIRTHFEGPPVAKGTWTADEEERLLRLVEKHGAHDWVKISDELGTRNRNQCRLKYMLYVRHGRFTTGTRRDKVFWMPEEMQRFKELLKAYGRDYARISKEMPGKTAQQLRFKFHRSRSSLSPESIQQVLPPPSSSLVSSSLTWTDGEVERFKELLMVHGTQFATIARLMPGRTVYQLRYKYVRMKHLWNLPLPEECPPPKRTGRRRKVSSPTELLRRLPAHLFQNLENDSGAEDACSPHVKFDNRIPRDPLAADNASEANLPRYHPLMPMPCFENAPYAPYETENCWSKTIDENSVIPVKTVHVPACQPVTIFIPSVEAEHSLLFHPEQPLPVETILGTEDFAGDEARDLSSSNESAEFANVEASFGDAKPEKFVETDTFSSHPEDEPPSRVVVENSAFTSHSDQMTSRFSSPVTATHPVLAENSRLLKQLLSSKVKENVFSESEADETSRVRELAVSNACFRETAAQIENPSTGARPPKRTPSSMLDVLLLARFAQTAPVQQDRSSTSTDSQCACPPADATISDEISSSKGRGARHSSSLLRKLIQKPIKRVSFFGASERVMLPPSTISIPDPGCRLPTDVENTTAKSSPTINSLADSAISTCVGTVSEKVSSKSASESCLSTVENTPPFDAASNFAAPSSCEKRSSKKSDSITDAGSTAGAKSLQKKTSSSTVPRTPKVFPSLPTSNSTSEFGARPSSSIVNEPKNVVPPKTVALAQPTSSSGRPCAKARKQASPIKRCKRPAVKLRSPTEPNESELSAQLEPLPNPTPNVDDSPAINSARWTLPVAAVPIYGHQVVVEGDESATTKIGAIENSSTDETLMRKKTKRRKASPGSVAGKRKSPVLRAENSLSVEAASDSTTRSSRKKPSSAKSSIVTDASSPASSKSSQRRSSSTARRASKVGQSPSMLEHRLAVESSAISTPPCGSLPTSSVNRRKSSVPRKVVTHSRSSSRTDTRGAKATKPPTPVKRDENSEQSVTSPSSLPTPVLPKGVEFSVRQASQRLLPSNCPALPHPVNASTNDVESASNCRRSVRTAKNRRKLSASPSEVRRADKTVRSRLQVDSRVPRPDSLETEITEKRVRKPKTILDL